VFETVIPRSVRLSEAPSYGLPIALYRPDSKGAEAYAALAAELRERDGRRTPVARDAVDESVSPAETSPESPAGVRVEAT
jgi:chromosome partitioning protein